MSGRALTAWLAVGLAAMVYGCTHAKAAAWEIWARPSGGMLREDRPNLIRLRREGEPPFATRAECQQAILSPNSDARLGFERGWALRCYQADEPASSVVVR